MEKKNTILPSDEIFTTSIRLTVMLILFSHKKILLNELKEILQLSSGNLDHHIRKLVNVGYIITYLHRMKNFFGRNNKYGGNNQSTELGKSSNTSECFNGSSNS